MIRIINTTNTTLRPGELMETPLSPLAFKETPLR
jgi:hypothetical protein